MRCQVTPRSVVRQMCALDWRFPTSSHPWNGSENENASGYAKSGFPGAPSLEWSKVRPPSSDRVIDISWAAGEEPAKKASEIEGIAKMANVSEEVLRIISMNRGWMKNYPVVLGLTKNPKTPVAVSMNLLSRLNERDLRHISTDRNVPDVLRVTARKKLVMDK